MTASRHLAGTSTSGAWPDRGRSGSDQVDDHFDVAAGCFGVRAGPVRFVDQVLRDAALEARKADVEAGAQKVAVVAQVQIYLGVDGEVGRQCDPVLARCQEIGSAPCRERVCQYV